jgi:hypothetical protein
MGKHHRIWLAALVLTATGGIAWLLLTSLEVAPVYQGKRLGAWLADLDTEMPPSNFSDTNGPASTAIQQIGTNAIPYLRSLLKVKDSHVKMALMSFTDRHSWLRIRLTPADVLHRRAASAAFCLGSRGSPLMPDIMAMFHSTNYDEAFTATVTIERMGYCNPESITRALAALSEPTNASPNFHERATETFLCLSQSMNIANVLHPDAFHDLKYKEAIPPLLKALNAPNDMPLCLGATLKPCCGAILKLIDPEAAAKAGVQ